MKHLSQFICEPDSKFKSSHAANLSVLSDGSVGCVCFRGSQEGAKDTVTTMQTFHSGTGWSNARIVAEENGYSVGNSVIMPVPGRGLILFYTLSYSNSMANWADSLIHYKFSGDNGQTWSPRFTVTEEIGFICKNSGLILSNGEWLLPIYDNRKGSQEQPGMGGNESSVIISRDNGDHWLRYGRMVADAGTAQPTVVELSAGHLLAFLRTRNWWNGEDPDWAFIYKSESLDYGRNWSYPEKTSLPNNNSGIQLIKLKNNVLALVYNHQNEKFRSPLNIALSYDLGKTWPVMREIEPFSQDRTEFSYPAIVQTADELIHVAYTYKRTHIKHVIMDIEWIENK